MDGSRRRDINGAALEYHEEGAGEAIVFVHGAPSDYRVWLPHCRELGSQYRVIAYSQRYFGRVDWDDTWPPFGVETHADDLIALCEQVGGGVHVVAWSYGGHVALTAACARPELFASVLIYEPGVPSFVTDANELTAFSTDANAMFGPVFAAIAQRDYTLGVRLLLAGSGQAPRLFRQPTGLATGGAAGQRTRASAAACASCSAPDHLRAAARASREDGRRLGGMYAAPVRDRVERRRAMYRRRRTRDRAECGSYAPRGAAERLRRSGEAPSHCALIMVRGYPGRIRRAVAPPRRCSLNENRSRNASAEA